MPNDTMSSAASLVGRLLLVAIFIWAGVGKITGYEGTVGYMQKFGVPGTLLPVVIALELGGGLLIAFGWQTRLVAFLLAGFTVVSAVIFHNSFDDRNQMIHFMKNLAITGGFLMLVANGPGGWSLDGRSRS
ncbi:MAG: DoxX family protein [Hyphomicrobiaceae bacterium]|nr:DoxX family protein [Hyphomicrobiaceae bacterium]